jgi:hypothetical protein
MRVPEQHILHSDEANRLGHGPADDVIRVSIT